MNPARAHSAGERKPEYRSARDERKPEYQAPDDQSPDGADDYGPDDLADFEPDDLLDGDVDAAASSEEPSSEEPSSEVSDVVESDVVEPDVVEPDAGENALTEREIQVLTFERQWWRHPGAKEQAIRDSFDLSATHYYQLLNGLLEHPAALAHDPMLVKRLRRLRSARRGPRLPDLRRGA